TCVVTVSAPMTVTATFNVTSTASPGAPGIPSVTQVAANGSGVTFKFAWTAGTGATSYRYADAYSDGSAMQQGSVTGLSVQLKMPYRGNKTARSASVCIQSVNAAGQTSGKSCASFTVPAPP